jgi:membrane protease YdiL (CAAX protease family)
VACLQVFESAVQLKETASLSHHQKALQDAVSLHLGEVAVAEETIFRGYLILRFRAVTGRTSAAVLLSSIVFSLGHGYEGMAGVISFFP